MRAVRRVLRDDGVVFWNLGDSYNSAASNTDQIGGRKKSLANMGRNKLTSELKPLDKCGVPERVALALQADGWYWRDTIIWAKGESFNPDRSGSVMPESQKGKRWERHRIKVKKSKHASDHNIKGGYKKMLEDASCHKGISPDWVAKWQDCPGCPKCEKTGGFILRHGNWRPTKSYEVVLMLTKTNKAWTDGEGVRESYEKPMDRWGGETLKANGKSNWDEGTGQSTYRDRNMRPNPSGRNLRNVWSINPEPFSGWIQTVHWRRVGQDAFSDDMRRITSLNCPIHGGSLDHLAKEFYDEYGVGFLNHKQHIDNYHAQEQGCDCDNLVQNIYDCLKQYNSDCFHRDNFLFAIYRNTQIRKKGHALLTNPSYTSFFQKISRIVDKSKLHEISYSAVHMLLSNILPDEMDDSLWAQIPYHIFDKSSFSPDCLCGIYKKYTKKSSHFATFPSKLVATCVKIATCERGACPTCGKQWARVIGDKTVINIRGNSTKSGKKGFPHETGWDDEISAQVSYQTLGYMPTCSCYPTPDDWANWKEHYDAQETVPAVVFDPFMGSGTVALTARRLGRSYIGTEISEEYIEMCNQRLEQEVMGI